MMRLNRGLSLTLSGETSISLYLADMFTAMTQRNAESHHGSVLYGKRNGLHLLIFKVEKTLLKLFINIGNIYKLVP